MQYKVEGKITALELAEALGLQLKGSKSQLLLTVGSLSNESSSVLKFSTKNQDKYLNGIVIGDIDNNAESLIISDNPRLDFCRALQYLVDVSILVNDSGKSCIHQTAIIADSAIIEPGVNIGKNTVIEHNVTIHKGSVIGDNTIIRSNTVIGAQGFGFEKNADGSWIRFPHLGRVIIGSNVEIGALNSVCVGALDNTIVSDGVKTDNLVHIAHNCQIGKNSILTACTELSGGVTLGEGVWMGPNSSTMQKITIGDFAVVGLGSVVTKNVESGHTVAGVPAKVIRRS
ncbi:UDP-3-O-(3-hydroxymyristoyl)glucosamine N-acyltransferase [Pseudoalteromonas sp. JSTW]|uniref:UDP-3-O-(3-hydroxymyristoyl)glucosamine N-acyltransferase n=1 Tax=Pseudoalteromonas sp. JSTW TaxID=2752475 RepID=UPI0015D5256C|nr:UDP-3-O-(3-hydroxymyristoyl)glucosamine N-acyltransferase [Pseudoalteromonas sp. JSTW]QLJ07983.1 UDP-3-O-(3-hydroxymyristoyl)glucosamine N-acyltransferase [Pseudoalteromonas sp. JSTW]